MLEERLKNAKSSRERQHIKGKMDALRREATDPELARLRRRLVGAARAGDTEAGDKISDQIYLHELKIGKVKE